VRALHTIPADLVTPLGAYLRLRGESAGSFLLESVERGRLGRSSFVGTGTRLVDVEEAERLDVPVVGYLAYDHAARLEPTVPLPDDGPGHPESRFVVADTLVRFDHGAGIAEVLAGDPDEISARLEAGLPETTVAPTAAAAGPLRRFPSQERYEECVRRCQAYIRAGDAYQIVPSQRAERPTSASPLSLYRALRRVNPSPYLFLLELGELALVGSSPERLVACEAGTASVCPIAGTTTPDEGDVERLLSSAKDLAEHVMLVDLGRNDLSRVCRAGTVRVTRSFEVERFSHVSHLVSEVVGEIRDGVTPWEVLRACFPAGTVTGAPKIRAMQIIAELEGYRRGPYAGAVGYVLPGGTMDTCIALRTIVLHGGVARLQAGAGVVADSDPESEHRECLAKLAALETAIDLAEAEYR
jgi:anthranilate synthase component 1